jgi:MFS superfamily sulfate permease-like transporter
VIGFTNGIALLIASTQIKDFLGMRIPDPRASSSRAWRVPRTSVDGIDRSHRRGARGLSLA